MQHLMFVGYLIDQVQRKSEGKVAQKFNRT